MCTYLAVLLDESKSSMETMQTSNKCHCRAGTKARHTHNVHILHPTRSPLHDYGRDEDAAVKALKETRWSGGGGLELPVSRDSPNITRRSLCLVSISSTPLTLLPRSTARSTVPPMSCIHDTRSQTSR